MSRREASPPFPPRPARGPLPLPAVWPWESHFPSLSLFPYSRIGVWWLVSHRVPCRCTSLSLNGRQGPRAALLLPRAGRVRWHGWGPHWHQEESDRGPPTQVSVPGPCPRLCTRVKGAWVATSCVLGKDTRKAVFPEHLLCAGYHAVYARNATSLSPQNCQ